MKSLLLSRIFVWVFLAVAPLNFLLAEPGLQTASRLPRTNLLVYHNRDGKVLPVKSKADWQKRRVEILRGMQSVMGELPGREKLCRLDLKVESETDCGSYVRRFVTYASEPVTGGTGVSPVVSGVPPETVERRAFSDGRTSTSNLNLTTKFGGTPNLTGETPVPPTKYSRVPAFLLIPKVALTSKKKFPAVLALHPTDMEFGHRVLVEQLRPGYRAYANDLAERGFVVLAPAYPLMANYQPDLKALGYRSGTMKAIWDNMRGLDLLESLPFVKRGKFGALGHSLGGHNAIYTAVFDERIKVVVSSCGFDSYVDYMNGNITGWTSERYMPKLAEYRGRLQEIPFDFHEMIAALAPRVCFINAPLGDANFKWRSVDEIVCAASQIYRLYGVGNNLRVEHPNCGHDFPERERGIALDLLQKSLKISVEFAGKGREKPIAVQY